ncbi:MAG: flagellar hook basal-body protein [Myxococcales bacterium]|nr:flagellar hook basal-body protein [Myxococcales bacterium]
MSDGIYAALSGALASFTQLETTANNLANVDTAGYRSVTPVFREVLAQQNGGNQANATVRFSTVRRTTVDTSPGAMRETGNPLDVAFPEDAFLALGTAAGERYTRAGSLHVAPDGTLSTQRGQVVSNEAQQPIVVDPGAHVTITEQGNVLADGESVGFLRIVTFERPGEMTYEGKGMLAANAEAGAPRPNARPLSVGHVEGSNASTVRAVTDLMSASRMFEAMEQAIGTFTTLDRRLVTTVMKPT